MAETYKIRCTLLGHSLDVRGVAAGETEGGKEFIVSGSRDKTAKVWMATELGGFDQFQSCEGHTNFVSCVSVVPPGPKYPQGLILTGGHDHTVLGFELGKPAPLFRLLGHKGTVCSIDHSSDGTLVTGSWDQTAKIWQDQNNIATLTGHEAAVWAVALVPNGGQHVLTGSADKTIRLWNGSQIVRAFTGHTDCVRALAVVDASRFLSGSNDATVRLWSIADGECLNIFYGHSNFIYSVALFPNGQDFVSCGEDRTVRVWKGADYKQTIHLPATSIWSVAVTKKGDIVTGSSDGTVRIFTADPDRYACPEEITKFEEEVAATTIAAQQELGGLKVSQLPGPEALLSEGKKDGDTQMIREGSQVSCYSWSGAERKWNKIGDVVGASGATQNTSGKVLHEGKEYDYVFSVDLDGTKTLKLPFNITEDPWFAAKRFIDKNDLNPQFLDQVANFIIQNTKGMTLGTSNDATYADPFTGGNRYVPGSSQGPARAGFDGLDPFTGSGAYKTQSATQASTSASQGAANPCFPVTNFLRFAQPPNADGLKSKLNQFSKETGSNLSEETIEFLISTVLDGQVSEEVLGLVRSLLEWPKDKVFPVLDLLRVGVLNEQFASSVVSQLPLFEEIVPKHLSGDPPTNQMLTLRLLNNLFGTQTASLMTYRGVIATQVLNNLAKPKNNQIAAATLFLNYSIVVTSRDNTQDPTWSGLENQTEILMSAITLVDVMEDTEAVYRILVALGNLLHGNPMSIQLFKGLSGESIAKNYQRDGGLPKIQQCATEILALIQ